ALAACVFSSPPTSPTAIYTLSLHDALGRFGLFEAHAVLAGDVLGELAATEGLLTRIDRLSVAEHGDVHDAGADVDQRDDLIRAAARQLPAEQLERRFNRQRLDNDDD